MAYYYDTLMKEVDYGKWADYIESIFAKNRVRPCLIADLGCGTGSFCIEMAKRGYDMIGIDYSADMLTVAKSKALESSADILFINQDIADFELYGTVDAIVSLMDSVNYITYKKDLKRLLKLVNNYLNPGGLFIFDVNSQYKFEKVFAGNVFCHVSEDISYIWQNYYDKRKKICRFELTFFARSDSLYSKFDEVHYERAYGIEELKKLIADSGLKLVGVYGEFEFKRPKKKSERIFFICKKGDINYGRLSNARV